MKARRDIERRIEKEKEKISELQSQIEQAEAFIKGLQEALKILPKDESDKFRKGKGILREGSDMAKIQGLIKRTGRPMHISEIVKGIGREDTKANRMSITGSLGRYVRANEFFTRVKPNTFYLINMASPIEEKVKLPPDFGTEEISNYSKDEF